MNTCECSHVCSDGNVKSEDESVKRKKDSSKPKWSLITTYKRVDATIKKKLSMGICDIFEHILLLVCVSIIIYSQNGQLILAMDTIRSESINNYTTISEIKENFYNELFESIDVLSVITRDNNEKITDFENRIIRFNKNYKSRISNNLVITGFTIIGFFIVFLLGFIWHVSDNQRFCVYSIEKKQKIIRKKLNDLERKTVTVPKSSTDNIGPHENIEGQIKDLSIIVEELSENMAEHFSQDSL